MHMVSIRDLGSALWAVGDLGNLSEESLKQSLEQLFQGVLQKLPVQVVPEAIEQTSRLLFKLYDREKTGFVLLRSVEVALTVLSGDTLSAKQRALFQLAVSCSRRQGTEDAFVSRAGLRNLLDDLSQVPAVVQESHVFGPVEAAIQSCFSGAINGRAGEEHFVSWLQSEPRLLLWLSTLYRLSVSEAVQHRVHCHACKAFPITGLRYRCLKCLNVHLCQNCFLTKKRTRKHKPSHPVLEYCTQPSWKESVASLASSARHVLLPRRYTRRGTERRRPLIAGSNEETHDSAHVSELQQQECADNLESLDVTVSENVPPSPPPPPPQLNMESKSLQTDESETQPQRKMSLLQKDLSITRNAMKDLQRDKWWLLEKEFQVWKVAAQSEHDSLEDRCTALEATMEALIQHNQQLEQGLGQVRHALSTRGRDEFGSDIHTPPPQQHSGDNTSEKQFTESESPASYTSSTTKKDEETPTGEVKEREQQMEAEETLNQVQEEGHIDVVVTETCVIETKKEVQLVGQSEDEEEEEEEEEEEPHLYIQELIGKDITLEGSAIVEDSGTDNSDEEEELCDLVQRLHGALLSTQIGKYSVKISCIPELVCLKAIKKITW
ncbi:dystrotelin isoform X3 [Ictalurus punctatus]|uniref:Dystrotelin isoform X3 n=1 Tax=Ictalurus punctatus TaxID=7998 RepID=A0A2D0S4F3_ICTPU|nr:dystrotelin isoform X3 [Ictalurus punctatus]